MKLPNSLHLKENSRETAVFPANLIKRHYKKLLLGLILFLVLALFNPSINFIKFILLIPIFIILGSFSTFYHNYFHGPIDFELVKLFTIVSSVAYGVIPGIFVGLSSTIFGRILSARIDQRMIFSVGSIFIIAVLAAAFSHVNIFVLGMVLVLVYHALTAPLSLMMGDNIGFGVLYISTNIIFNLLFFSKIAPFLLSFA